MENLSSERQIVAEQLLKTMNLIQDAIDSLYSGIIDYDKLEIICQSLILEQYRMESFASQKDISMISSIIEVIQSTLKARDLISLN